MKKKSRRYPHVLFLAGLAVVLAGKGCAGRQTVAERGSACDPSETALAAASNRLIDADNARDLEGVLAGYTDDVVWLPPTGEVITGKSAIRPRYETLFSGFDVSMTTRVSEARADGSGELGFVRGVTSGTLTPLTGAGSAQRVSDKFIALLRCEAGEWLVSHLMWSPRS